MERNLNFDSLSMHARIENLTEFRLHIVRIFLCPLAERGIIDITENESNCFRISIKGDSLIQLTEKFNEFRSAFHRAEAALKESIRLVDEHASEFQTEGSEQ